MQTSLLFQLVVATFCRFLLKTGRRFLYPFAGVVSVGLGVSLAAVTTLLALNQLAALLSPLFGPLIDRWGCRTMLGIGLSLAATSMLAVGLLPSYALLLLALVAVGLAISICDPALQAYVGKMVPFAQRGRAIGLTEVAWAASALIGIPGAGLLIHQIGWQAPFVVMGLLALGGGALLYRVLPAEKCAHIAIQPRQMLTATQGLLRQRTARASLLYAFLVSCANDIFFVVYGLWLAESFGVSMVALGLATTVIGVAELTGELLTASVADRLGLRRTALVTLVACAVCYALLPVWGFSVLGALVGIFLLCLAFEFNLVATISLTTEIYPTARATMMSAFQAASGLGHVCGVLIGGAIWLAGGIAGVGVVCAALCVVGLVVIYRGLHAESPVMVASRRWRTYKLRDVSPEVNLPYEVWCQQMW